MTRTSALLGTCILILVLAAAALVCLDARNTTTHDLRVLEFQRVIGGLCLGPAVELERGAPELDHP